MCGLPLLRGAVQALRLAACPQLVGPADLETETGLGSSAPVPQDTQVRDRGGVLLHLELDQFLERDVCSSASRG